MVKGNPFALENTVARGKENVETEYKIAAILYNLGRAMSILGLEELKRRLKRHFTLVIAYFTVLSHKGAGYNIFSLEMSIINAKYRVHHSG